MFSVLVGMQTSPGKGKKTEVETRSHGPSNSTLKKREPCVVEWLLI